MAAPATAAPSASAGRAFEHREIVGFEATNLVGNVYFVNHLRWQGKCREMFLLTHCPDVLDALAVDLAMVTTRCACDYFVELEAFDEVIVRMRLGEVAQNRVTMLFDYVLRRDGREELAARGEQQIACMARRDGRTVPTPVPASLRAALERYA